MKFLKAVTVPMIIVSLTGCAAIFAAKTVPVAMQTNPSSAEVWIEGNRMGLTPITLSLSNKKSYVVTFKKEGQEATYQINSKVGTTWVILDMLAGFAPIVIDAATGSWYKLDPTIINVNLAPVSSK